MNSGCNEFITTFFRQKGKTQSNIIMIANEFNPPERFQKRLVYSRRTAPPCREWVFYFLTHFPRPQH